MIIPLAFWFLLIITVSIGWLAGNLQDRMVIIAIIAAAISTNAAQFLLSFPMENFAITVVNIILFAVVWHYARNSPNYWTIWFAGFQGATSFLSLFAFLLPPGGQRALLDMSAAFWAIPALIVMAAGLTFDRHMRTHRE